MALAFVMLYSECLPSFLLWKEQRNSGRLGCDYEIREDITINAGCELFTLENNL